MRALLLILAAFAFAHSAMASVSAPPDRICPICGAVTATIRPIDYRQFNIPYEALKVLSYEAEFSICPYDLYASSFFHSEKVTQEERGRLTEFLRHPTVHLTDREKEIVNGHLEELKATTLWEKLWVRSCDEIRQPDPRHRLAITMNLLRGIPPDKLPWEHALSAEFRNEAIQMLHEATTADWTNADDKRVFPYLEAELLRQAGHRGKAKQLFLSIVERERKSSRDKRFEWLAQECDEELQRIEAAGMSSADLLAWVLAAMPDPSKNKGVKSLDGWVKHQIALEELIRRSIKGDGSASEILWSILDHNEDRLSSLIGTLRESDAQVSALRSINDIWRNWFDEISHRFPLQSVPYNPLNEIVPQRFSDTFRKTQLVPAVKAALEKGGLPDVNRDGADLMNELEVSLEKTDPEQHVGIGRIMLRTMHSLGVDDELLHYPAPNWFRNLASMKNVQSEFTKEIDGEWKNSFWKAVCDYIADVPNASRHLVDSLDAKEFSVTQREAAQKVVWTLLASRRDPLWKEKATSLITGGDSLNDELVDYVVCLGDPELTGLLEARLNRERSAIINADWSAGNTMRKFDEDRAKRGLTRLYIR